MAVLAMMGGLQETCRELAGKLEAAWWWIRFGHAVFFFLILQNLETQLLTRKLTPKLWHLKFDRCHVLVTGANTHSAHFGEMIETLHWYALSVRATKASGETPQSPPIITSSLICSASKAVRRKKSAIG